MDGQLYNLSNSTNCLNISDSGVKQFQDMRIFSIVSIVLLVPTLILQLFFICRYKSTFLHRQFFYTTIFVLLYYIVFIVYLSTVDVGCFFALLNSLGWYLLYVEIMQITTIHLLLLYKLCKYMQTRTMQRLQTLCCNIRPRPRHEMMIVCIQLGLPLPILITEIVILKTNSIYFVFNVESYIQISLVAVNTPMGLICTVLLVFWFCMLWKRRLLKNKVKFVCTEMGYILLVLVVGLIGNILLLLLLVPSSYDYNIVTSVMQTFPLVSFGVYIIISIRSLRK